MQPAEARQFWMGLFVDSEGQLEPEKIAYMVSYLVIIVIGVRGALNGQWDAISFGFGWAALTLNYAAGAGRRAQTKARFKRLTDKVASLEARIDALQPKQ